MDRPFVVDPVYTGIARAFRLAPAIADMVLPRIQVAEKFAYHEFSLKEDFRVPDNRVGRTSRPNQVVSSSSRKMAETVDYALDHPVPIGDIEAGHQAGIDVKGRAVELIEKYNESAREIRVANMVMNPANYGANTLALSGASQWTDPTNDPIAAIKTQLDAMILRPNIAALPRNVATALQLNPNVIKAAHGNSGDKGVAAMRAIADLLELDEIYIGARFFDAAKPGQAANLARAWADHAAFLYIDKNAQNTESVTFGFTGQYGQKDAGEIPDPDVGRKGGVRMRSGESLKELIVAPEAGFLFQNAA